MLPLALHNAVHYAGGMSDLEEPVSTGKRGDTRLRLMQAAERLFGERGLHAVTLKEINAAAGQRNESALHYHFGSKQRLVDAILNMRVAAIDRVRAARIDALTAERATDDLRAVIRATFEPLTELLDTEEGVRFVRFAAQVLNDPDFDLPTIALKSGFEGIARANSLIVTALADLPPEVAIQRQRLMIEMVLTSLALWTRRPDAMANEPARRFFVEGLFDSVHGALSAPVSAETLAALKAAAKG